VLLLFLQQAAVALVHVLFVVLLLFGAVAI
jgi:hypothetical protein